MVKHEKPKQPPAEMTNKLAELQRQKNRNAERILKVAAALDRARAKKNKKK